MSALSRSLEVLRAPGCAVRGGGRGRVHRDSEWGLKEVIERFGWLG